MGSQAKTILRKYYDLLNMTMRASRGVPTPTHSKLVYSQMANLFPNAQPERIMGDGDGTVTLGSLQSCKDFLNIGSGDAFYQFDDVNHGDILKNKKVLMMIEQVL